MDWVVREKTCLFRKRPGRGGFPRRTVSCELRSCHYGLGSDTAAMLSPTNRGTLPLTLRAIILLHRRAFVFGRNVHVLLHTPDRVVPE